MVHKIWQPYPTIESGLNKVKNTMKASVKLPMKELNDKIIEYIDAPGKYLRSGLTLMVAESLNLTIDSTIINGASAVEFLHLATLIHDDVIDQADKRRGIEVIHQHYNNRIAIYAGDYLLALSGRLLESTDLKIDMNIIDKTIIEQILIGELRQMMNSHQLTMTMMDYLRQIQGKTAVLFGMATMLSGIKAQLPKRDVKRLYYAGQMIGMAFQLNDDLIDFQLDENLSGKPQFQDVQNGIYTAPYILLKQKINLNLNQYSNEELYQLMVDNKVFEEVIQIKQSYLKKALHHFSQVGVDNQPFAQLLRLIN